MNFLSKKKILYNKIEYNSIKDYMAFTKYEKSVKFSLCFCLLVHCLCVVVTREGVCPFAWLLFVSAALT